MLQKLSEQIRQCYERAAQAMRKAEAAADPAFKVDFRDVEERWLALARSYEFTERLADFTAAMSDRLHKDHGAAKVRTPLLGPLFDLLPVALYVCDPDGLILQYNHRAAELWGRSPKLEDSADRYCGSHRMYRVDGDPVPHGDCPMADVLRTGISVRDREIVIERPDGSRGIAVVNIEVLKDLGGNILGAVNCFQDITEQNLKDELILRLASVVESSDDAIITKSLDGIVTSWNLGAERLYGYEAEEAAGKSVTFLIPPDCQDEEPAIIERIRRGEHVEPYDTIRRRKDGSLVEISLTVSPIKNLQGKIVGASQISRDITSRKRTEQEFATLAREAEHRAKNVLATVQAIVHLSRSKTPAGLRRAIEERIQALANVHGLFSESRWVGAELTSLVTQELAPYCRDGEARVRIDGPNVLLEPSTAQMVAVTLHELATNAAKYGALSVPEGHIQVEWSRVADGRLVLRWTESGGPPVKKPTRQGFGTRVMEWMVTCQDKGEMHLDWRAEGLACEIVLRT